MSNFAVLKGEINMKKEYKNLLFDLGGVILDLKRSACVEAFKKLGLENAENVFGEYSQTGVFLALEEGLVSPEEFPKAKTGFFPI